LAEEARRNEENRSQSGTGHSKARNKAVYTVRRALVREKTSKTKKESRIRLIFQKGSIRLSKEDQVKSIRSRRLQVY
jgi:hypothetical protein